MWCLGILALVVAFILVLWFLPAPELRYHDCWEILQEECVFTAEQLKKARTRVRRGENPEEVFFELTGLDPRDWSELVEDL